MQRLTVFLLGILIAGTAVIAVDAADEWVVGEKWVYEHEGPMPWRPPDREIVGNRVLEVVSIQGEAEEKRWLIRDEWGENDDRPATLYLNKSGMCDRIEVGDTTVRIEPAYPVYNMNLKPGEEKEFESRFMMGEGRTFTQKIKAKRVDDVTLEVPAGKFENCMHVKRDETISFVRDGGEGTVKVTREHWYHPKVRGAVKEVFRYSLGEGTSPVGKSVLKAHSKEEK